MAWSSLFGVLCNSSQILYVCVCVCLTLSLSLGQDCISPLFNEVLRPPMLSALDTLCHYRALVTGGGRAV